MVWGRGQDGRAEQADLACSPAASLTPTLLFPRWPPRPSLSSVVESAKIGGRAAPFCARRLRHGTAAPLPGGVEGRAWCLRSMAEPLEHRLRLFYGACLDLCIRGSSDSIGRQSCGTMIRSLPRAIHPALEAAVSVAVAAANTSRAGVAATCVPWQPTPAAAAEARAAASALVALGALVAALEEAAAEVLLADDVPTSSSGICNALARLRLLHFLEVVAGLEASNEHQSDGVADGGEPPGSQTASGNTSRCCDPCMRRLLVISVLAQELGELANLKRGEGLPAAQEDGACLLALSLARVMSASPSSCGGSILGRGAFGGSSGAATMSKPVGGTAAEVEVASSVSAHGGLTRKVGCDTLPTSPLLAKLVLAIVSSIREVVEVPRSLASLRSSSFPQPVARARPLPRPPWANVDWSQAAPPMSMEVVSKAVLAALGLAAKS
mmetsp:Transcript_65210/g.187509  ORF Transcript_65210/g.187509 Transcript_65210/m.187509 type:complete len:439 (+) Transcript_65210:220-1536(+)